jgi:hypothetical protein
MTKQSIENTLLHNRRPIAVHAIWAQFERMRQELKNAQITIKGLEKKLNKQNAINTNTAS